MKAYQLMKKQVVKVNERDPMQRVIEKFLFYRISGMPVVNDQNEIVGYISVDDILRYIGKPNDLVLGTPFFMNHYQIEEGDFVERAQKVRKMNVMVLAQTKVYTVAWDEDIETITAIFAKGRAKKVLVERMGVLAGIISGNDVICHSFISLTELKRDCGVMF